MRSASGVLLQPSKAALAAPTALSTSALEPSEITPNAVSSAGLMTSKSLGVVGGTQAPLM